VKAERMLCESILTEETYVFVQVFKNCPERGNSWQFKMNFVKLSMSYEENYAL